MKTDPRRKQGYLPTLDGWRAIAILAVIFHHDSIHRLGPLSTRAVYEYGAAGVDVFFAISGLLICSRLLDEERLTGRIHLRQFYVRRVFRILPPAFLYLGIIACLAGLGLFRVSPGEWLESALFCRNYGSLFAGALGQPGWYTGHFWSLALEEQFYMVLPALLVFTPRRYRVAVLTLLAALIAVHRVYALRTRPWMHLEFHADVRLDALLIPALFALLVASPALRLRFGSALRFWPVLVLAVLALLPFGEGTAWHISLLEILMPCVVLGSVLNPGNLFGRLLEWSWLRYIGRISYSLYLWQQLFFTQHFVVGAPLGVLQGWPMRLGMTFGCALLSYYLVERPTARLGHRWAPSPRPGRPDLQAESAGEFAPAQAQPAVKSCSSPSLQSTSVLVAKEGSS